MLFVAFVMFFSSVSGSTLHAQSPLERLTVPFQQLPAECRLTSSDSVHVDGKVRGGLWAGLPITGNPWVGSDVQIVAAIRERTEPPYPVPDGPPMTRAELARTRLRLAEGVEAAYAAVYADAAERLVIVTAFTLVSTPAIVAKVTGEKSACYAAVSAHVREITRPIAVQ